MKYSYIVIALLLCCTSCKTDKKDSEAQVPVKKEQQQAITTSKTGFEVTPIQHATMVLNWDDTILYVDPVGGAQAFASHDAPDLILITDIHGDHFSLETLQALDTNKAKIIAPQAVADLLPAEFDAQIDVLNNGEIKERFGFNVEAIPMYNLRPESLKFHEKGRGNGYVIEKNGKRVYISGDTEDIPEMLALENIDIAFICINLPYTMTEIQAARAVAAFKPTIVYPYHYKGATGYSNMDMFSAMVKKSSAGREVKVIDLDWYPVKN